MVHQDVEDWPNHETRSVVGKRGGSQRGVSEKQVILGYLQPLSALSPFRASNMCDKPCRIAQVYENGSEGVCRMVTSVGW